MEPTTSSFSVLRETKFSVLEPATRSKPGTSLDSIPEEDLKKLSLPSEFFLPSEVLATQSKQEPNTIWLSEIRHVDTVVGVGDYIEMEGGRHLVTSICAKRSEANPAEIVDVLLETQPPGFRSLFCLSVSMQVSNFSGNLQFQNCRARINQVSTSHLMLSKCRSSRVVAKQPLSLVKVRKVEHSFRCEPLFVQKRGKWIANSFGPRAEVLRKQKKARSVRAPTRERTEQEQSQDWRHLPRCGVASSEAKPDV